jgi:hypothetical protein
MRVTWKGFSYQGVSPELESLCVDQTALSRTYVLIIDRAFLQTTAARVRRRSTCSDREVDADPAVFHQTLLHVNDSSSCTFCAV